MKPTDYPIFLVYSKEDSAWLARVDMLGGCVADGTTPEEALANVKQAIDLWIETNKELGRPIPPALDLQEIEDFQLRMAEAQGQKIQQLIQEGVSQALQQIAKLTGEKYAGRGYLLPPARISDLTAA